MIISVFQEFARFLKIFQDFLRNCMRVLSDLCSHLAIVRSSFVHTKLILDGKRSKSTGKHGNETIESFNISFRGKCKQADVL